MEFRCSANGFFVLKKAAILCLCLFIVFILFLFKFKFYAHCVSPFLHRDCRSQSIYIYIYRGRSFHSYGKQYIRACFFFSPTLVSTVRNERELWTSVDGRKKNTRMYCLPYEWKERLFTSVRLYFAANGIYPLAESGGLCRSISLYIIPYAVLNCSCNERRSLNRLLTYLHVEFIC